MKCRVTPIVGLLWNLFYHTVRLGLGSVGLVKDLCRDVHPSANAACFYLNRLPRRLRRGVGRGLVVTFFIFIRLVERVNGGQLGADRRDYCVAYL